MGTWIRGSDAMELRDGAVQGDFGMGSWKWGGRGDGIFLWK